jgi:hypothetical protein
VWLCRMVANKSQNVVEPVGDEESFPGEGESYDDCNVDEEEPAVGYQAEAFNAAESDLADEEYI